MKVASPEAFFREELRWYAGQFGIYVPRIRVNVPEPARQAYADVAAVIEHLAGIGMKCDVLGSKPAGDYGDGLRYVASLTGEQGTVIIERYVLFTEPPQYGGEVCVRYHNQREGVMRSTMLPFGSDVGQSIKSFMEESDALGSTLPASRTPGKKRRT
ncbi:MAG: hypothetical protein HYY37_05715 [Candidatus Aenigmarchaeota archaeon]|nr:hypothetical protein [Candidatus Aenigmarchaeota archaeon]